MDQSSLERYVNNGLEKDISLVNSISSREVEDLSFSERRLKYIEYEKIRRFADNVSFSESNKNLKSNFYELQMSLKKGDQNLNKTFEKLYNWIVSESNQENPDQLLYKTKQMMTLASDVGMYELRERAVDRLFENLKSKVSKQNKIKTASVYEHNGNLVFDFPLKKEKSFGKKIRNYFLVLAFGAACAAGSAYYFGNYNNDLIQNTNAISEKDTVYISSTPDTVYVASTPETIVEKQIIYLPNAKEKKQNTSVIEQKNSIDSLVVNDPKKVVLNLDAIHRNDANIKKEPKKRYVTKKELILRAINERIKKIKQD